MTNQGKANSIAGQWVRQGFSLLYINRTNPIPQMQAAVTFYPVLSDTHMLLALIVNVVSVGIGATFGLSHILK